MNTKYSCDYNHLNSQGYVVIKNFFTDEIVDLLVKKYTTSDDSSNKNYSVAGLDNFTRQVLHNSLSTVLNEISNHTDIKNCIQTWDGGFLNNEKIKFGFHQDHECYFIFQNLNKYLIFYIPLIKQFQDKSGLTIVPNNIIKEKLPEYSDVLLNSGAKSYKSNNDGTTTVSIDSTDQKVLLPIDIKSLAVVPNMLPGDLLIMMGNIIHATQDSDTFRLALSVRYVDGDIVIDKNKLFNDGGQTKKKYLSNNIKRYKEIENFFVKNNLTETKAKDLLKEFSLRVGL